MDPKRLIAPIVLVGVITATVLGVSMFGTPTSEYRATLDTTLLPEGLNEISVLAYDEAGNVGTDTITVIVDNKASEPTSVTATRAVVVAWTKPIDAVQFKVKESLVSFPTTTGTEPGARAIYTGTAGSYTDKTPNTFYSVFAKDRQGRWSEPAEVAGP